MFNKIKNKIKYFVAPLIVIGVVLVCPFSVLAIDDKGVEISEPINYDLDFGELPRMKRSSVLSTYSIDTPDNYILNVDDVNAICPVMLHTPYSFDNFFINNELHSCSDEFLNINGIEGSKTDYYVEFFDAAAFSHLGSIANDFFNPCLYRIHAPWITSSGTSNAYYFYVYFFFNLQNVNVNDDYVVDFTITAFDQPADIFNPLGVSLMYDSDGVTYSDFINNRLDKEHITELHFNPVDCYLPSERTFRRHFNFVVSGDILKNSVRLGFRFYVNSVKSCYFGLSKGTSFTVRKYDPTTDTIVNVGNSILNAGDGYSNPDFNGTSNQLNNITNNINNVGDDVEVDIPDMNTRYKLASQLLEIDGMGQAFENINIWLVDFVDSNLIIYMLITLSLVIALFVHIIGRGFN